MVCELDLVVFTCCRCGGAFDVTQGTWLPIGIEVKKPITVLSGSREAPPIILGLDLRKPEFITEDEFTCYDCCP